MSRISFSELSVVILLVLSYPSLSFDFNKKGSGAYDNFMKSVRNSRTNALKMKCYIKEISIQSLKLLPNDNIYYKVICKSSDGVNYDWNIEKNYRQFDEFEDTCNNYFVNDQYPFDGSSRGYNFDPEYSVDFINEMIEHTRRRSIPAALIYDFLEFPQDLKSDLDVDSDKIKYVEIFDEDFPHSVSQTTTEVDAAIAGAVIGSIVAGPVGAMVAGATAALVSNRDDKVGEVARTMGRVVQVTGKKIKKIDDNYHIVDRVKDTTTKLTNQATQKITKINRKYGVTKKIESVVDKGLKNMRNLLDNLDKD